MRRTGYWEVTELGVEAVMLWWNTTSVSNAWRPYGSSGGGGVGRNPQRTGWEGGEKKAKMSGAREGVVKAWIPASVGRNGGTDLRLWHRGRAHGNQRLVIPCSQQDKTM